MGNELSLLELLKMSPEQLRYEDICRLTDEQKNKYGELLDHFQCVNSSAASTQEKGDALEQLVSFLLNVSGGIFKVSKNVKTETNEIDEIIELNQKGRVLSSLGLLPNRLVEFLGECKNYGKAISVTYVGKFYSLLLTTNMRTGVLFSYHGVSGKDWKDGSGLIKKIYLQRERDEDRVAIIDFKYEDFESILNGHNFLEIIETKLKSLRYDTSVGNISQHPAEDSFRENLSKQSQIE